MNREKGTAHRFVQDVPVLSRVEQPSCHRFTLNRVVNNSQYASTLHS